MQIHFLLFEASLQPILFQSKIVLILAISAMLSANIVYLDKSNLDA